MKDFLSILNHLFQAYIVLCISLLFKEGNGQFTGLQVCSEAIFFRLNGITWKIFSLSCNRKVAFCCIVMQSESCFLLRLTGVPRSRKTGLARLTRPARLM